ncbi:unannotated protein [freshwater metagenome]|uniref:Unannotated protein n=1 Tax=freshwater metagenome TaxID=449393 RepID=A0A6J7HYT4_9ZZZZ
MLGDRDQIPVERVRIEQVPLGGSSAGVTDHARGPARYCHRPMTELLETTQEQQRDEIADVQTVSGRVEPGVHADRPLSKSFTQSIEVGGVVDQTAGGKIIDDVGMAHLTTLPDRRPTFQPVLGLNWRIGPHRVTVTAWFRLIHSPRMRPERPNWSSRQP